MAHPLARKELAHIIDHTLRRGDATCAEIETLCAQARTHGFFSVAVPGSRVLQAAHWLEDSKVQINCVINAPDGADDSDVKRFAVETAVDHGAEMIEVTVNHGRLKDADDTWLLRELHDLVEAADERPVSMAIEPTWLNPLDIARLCRLVREANVKGLTVSALHNPAATLDTMRQIREACGDNFGIKVDGNRFELQPVLKFLDAGATRFGMTGGVALLESL